MSTPKINRQGNKIVSWDVCRWKPNDLMLARCRHMNEQAKSLQKGKMILERNARNGK